MLKYASWKSWIFIGFLVLGLFYSLPTWYGEDPALQIALKAKGSLTSTEAETLHLKAELQKTLQEAGLSIKSLDASGASWWLCFPNTLSQMQAKAVLEKSIFRDPKYSLSLNLLPAAPAFFKAFGAGPIKLGLDLRGGVYFLLDVDLKHLLKKRLEGYVGDLRKAMQAENIRYAAVNLNSQGVIRLGFKDSAQKEKAEKLLLKQFMEFSVSNNSSGHSSEGENAETVLDLSFNELGLQNINHQTMEQTVLTLRNRVNELGVAEAIVQSQGKDKIVVELPGIQDTAYAKKMLGKTATLEFRMEAEEIEWSALKNHGVVSPGTQIFEMEGRDPKGPALQVLLKKEIVLTGDSIIYASNAISAEGRPEVNIRLSGGSTSGFNQITGANIGKRMAVVYKEWRDNQFFERVISLATIQSALGNSFHITGLGIEESKDLALLLRSGNLPTPVSIVEERIIGPSLGQDNIKMGIVAATAGISAVAVFMCFYYGLMGLFANLCLISNLIMLLALLAGLDATITLPGIAGIVLTLGMAVDANVLIFERIREELRRKASPIAALQRGFEGAWETIFDSNLTTLISGLVLFTLGSGPIKGFAVTLSLGILTSLFTSVLGCRVLVQWYYGSKRQIKSIAVGV
ncbi:MAG: protein translocase subunit SecD [Gammaproteobacteria bacterium]